jgi:hypothetical protein
MNLYDTIGIYIWWYSVFFFDLTGMNQRYDWEHAIIIIEINMRKIISDDTSMGVYQFT